MGTAWRKSSYSSSQGGECVECAALGRGIAVRDSKNPDGPRLRFTATAWHAFLDYATSMPPTAVPSPNGTGA
ncbi:DUF397 domain-containing protein [Streptomyces sparsogenes]|uniref:DUF397 domain-containing protein n=1 Tax=Streptomyces sparsogenes DSM 40356 TaxID=1331668 RepID=A0A1R1S559_9ACTN|nr:DUF397 domain-containing protein [Streptomyces sparsogenes]OMI33332.1 hypothetical protein SPAR_41894 [Streptomyces sparsogenes DSM 40356]